MNHPFGYSLEELEALYASAWHWLENWENTEEAKLGSIYCACCQYAMDEDKEIGCDKCPIMSFTKQEGCKGTPYYEASTKIYSYQIKLFEVPTLEEVKEACEKEYKFLIDLCLGKTPNYILEDKYEEGL